jgi:4-hydroxy-tetrahydrodipicolinate synthase
MEIHTGLAGVYAAAVTPLNEDLSPALTDLLSLMEFLAERGCHGALLCGTTGEGPSFSPAERMDIWKSAAEIRHNYPDFKLLAGTGTPSLTETTELTRAAFDLGMDGVVVLPPYYYRSAPEEGLFNWFNQVIERAVPPQGAFIGYHIPGISGVPLSTNLIARLSYKHPGQFIGLKDSSNDLNHARLLGETFGSELLIMSGNDLLFEQALESGASGCITAMANLASPDLRRVWDAHQKGVRDEETQARLDAIRALKDSYPPAASLIKALLHRLHQFPLWPVRPPLTPMPEPLIEKAAEELTAIRNV